jgi:hypothetical protein
MTAEEGKTGGGVWLLIQGMQFRHHGEHEVATKNHKKLAREFCYLFLLLVAICYLFLLLVATVCSLLFPFAHCCNHLLLLFGSSYFATSFCLLLQHFATSCNKCQPQNPKFYVM